MTLLVDETNKQMAKPIVNETNKLQSRLLMKESFGEIIVNKRNKWKTKLWIKQTNDKTNRQGMKHLVNSVNDKNKWQNK